MGFFELLLILIFSVVSLAGTILWIWALVDCITNEPSEGNDKLIWVLVIVLTHMIGAIIYFVVRRPQRRATLGK